MTGIAGRGATKEEMSHREVLTVLTGVMAAILVAALDQTIVATVLPTIVDDLGGLSRLSWVVSAYLLTLTVSIPLYGKVSDLYGRKRLFQLAVAVFVAGSIACALAGSMGQLIAFRALQGMGAGGIIALAQTIVADIVSPRERGRYAGYIGGVYAVAGIAGPLVGGSFVEHLGWRWAFWINLPLGAAAIGIIGRNLWLDWHPVRRSIDYLGAALLSLGAAALLLGLVWGGDVYPWASPVLIGLAGVVGLALIGFVVAERRAPEPILPPELFGDRVFAASCGLGFIVGAVMLATVVFLPLFLQTVTGMSAISSGLLLIPLVAGVVTAAVGSGRLVTRWGRYKAFPIVGTALLALSMELFSTLTPATGPLLISISMVLAGIGIGLVIQVIVVAVQNAVPARHLGVATAAIQFFRSIGGAVGVAAFGAALNARLAATGQLAGSIPHVFAWMVPLALLATALSWLLPERPLRTTTHRADVGA